jgi:hypothetical protein
MSPYRTSERTLLGGVDVTDVDLTKPFTVDFSVPADATTAIKRAALERARTAHAAFDPVGRRWLVRANMDLVNVGRCVLHVFPLPS